MPRLYLRRAIVDIQPEAGSIKRIDGLRVKFRVEKTSEGNPNKAEIEIYNLSQKTVGLLQTQNIRILLYAGYQSTFYLGAGNLLPNFVGGNIPDVISSRFEIKGVPQTDSTVELIFKGSIAKMVHKKASKEKKLPVSSTLEGPDLITKLEVQDGLIAFRNARHTKGYPPGTTTKEIVNDVAKSAQVPLASKTEIPDFTYANGITLRGLVRDHLFHLAEKDGLNWSFQDETLVIQPKGQPSKEPAVLMSPTSGLVGVPILTTKGCEFKSLLQGSLKVGRQVILQDSRFVTGAFIIKKVTHEGDTWGGEFISHCECYRI